MKKNTKILIAVCCVLAILVTSVIGTIAYLTETTDEVINTFVVGKLLEDNTKFILKEHQAFDGVDGSVDTVKDESVSKCLKKRFLNKTNNNPRKKRHSM